MDELIDRFNSVPLTQKTLVLFLMMAAIFALYFMGLHSPMISDIETANDDLRELQQTKESLEEKSQQVEQMREDLQKIDRELGEAQRALPESRDIVDVLQRIYSNAQSAGLTIETFQRDDEEQAEDVVEVPVDMEMVGTFEQVAEFFFAVGDMRRIITIEDVTMQREEGELEEDGTLRVTARATTYYAAGE